MSRALLLDHVSRHYGEADARTEALVDASLSVDAGELVAIMGPSGSGKSTLLTIAGGLEVPSAGSVWVFGSQLDPTSSEERARVRRERIGYVFQDLNLLPGLTAVENVMLPMELSGMRAKAARQRASQHLDEVGLGHRRDRFPEDLSGGERQRVAIARALTSATDSADTGRLILADEPTGALDSGNGEGIMGLFRRAVDRGCAALFVTHDATLAAWADRIVFLRDGRLVDRTALPDPTSLLGAR
jgi:putative ABC transport system ATP-binding protein